MSINGLGDAKMGWEMGFSEGVEDLREAIAWVIVVGLFLGIVIPKIIEVFSQAGLDTTIIKNTLNMLYIVLGLLGVVGIVALLVAFFKAIDDWEYGLGRAFAILLGSPLLFVVIYAIAPHMNAEVTGLMLLTLDIIPRRDIRSYNLGAPTFIS